MGPLITPEHLAAQRAEHNRKAGDGPHKGEYGVQGYRWAKHVLNYAASLGATSVLDYGAGKGSLHGAISGHIACVNYDPVTFPGDPTAADLVVCTDVLPFVEPDCVPNVLAHIKSLATKGVFIVVPHHPDYKGLQGQAPLTEWKRRLQKVWPDNDTQTSGTTRKYRTVRLEFRGRC